MPCLTEIVNDLKKQVKHLSSGNQRFESLTPSRSSSSGNQRFESLTPARSSSCSSSPRPSSPDIELEMVSVPLNSIIAFCIEDFQNLKLLALSYCSLKMYFSFI